ncbi:hypothetical protein Acsp05_51330 [Actinokineospora sp. NBRC 105648]|nr:hypothetical protein Acsp05_51330 [Actinokineospora sp. NBRC 105648]
MAADEHVPTDEHTPADEPEPAEEHAADEHVPADEHAADEHVPTVRPRKPLPAWAIALIAVLITAVGFVVFRYVLDDDAPTAECAAVTGADDQARVETVDCDDDAATFRVASRLDLSDNGCAEGAYRELRTDKQLLCLMPNFQAGRCYVADEPNQSFRVSGCESPESIRISQVLDGTADPSPCPEGNGIGYPEPPTVFCVETPKTP